MCVSVPFHHFLVFRLRHFGRKIIVWKNVHRYLSWKNKKHAVIGKYSMMGWYDVACYHWKAVFYNNSTSRTVLFLSYHSNFPMITFSFDWRTPTLSLTHTFICFYVICIHLYLNAWNIHLRYSSYKKPLPHTGDFCQRQNFKYTKEKDLELKLNSQKWMIWLNGEFYT